MSNYKGKKNNSPTENGGSTTITYYPPGEKSKGRRVKVKSLTELFELFERTTPPPPESGNKNDLRAWSPATLKDDTRKRDNVESVFALVFDFDKVTTTIEEALALYEGRLACAHTSWSHTPGYTVVSNSSMSQVPFECGVRASNR